MFCKWCGNNLTSSDIKCKRCGREVPALSDCGGFYDLVPNAKKTADTNPGPVDYPEKPERANREPEQPKYLERKSAKNNHKKSFLALAIVMAVGFAFVLVMLFAIHGKVNKYSNEISGLRFVLYGISDKMSALEEEETLPPETTVPAPVEEPVLTEQDVLITVKLAELEGAQVINTDYDLGDYSDIIATSNSFDGNTGLIANVTYALKNAAGSLKLDFICKDDYYTKNVAVCYEIDDTAFGLSEAPETFKWQYRFDAESDWADFPDGIFIQAEDSGKTGLTIRKRVLTELMADSEGPIELRCEIYRANTDDGSLSIVIEGIRFYDETRNTKQAVG